VEKEPLGFARKAFHSESQRRCQLTCGPATNFAVRAHTA
jgi:hypothetical protein